MKKMADLTVIGAGLAGTEAAWQAAQRGLVVDLFEMRPEHMTPAHRTGDLAELVCSTSFRGAGLHNAVGLLKEELRRCESLFMAIADKNAIPAGGALAVDRDGFAVDMTEAILSHPKLNLYRQEVADIPTTGSVIIATGPLTSDKLAHQIGLLTGQNHLYFYDAIAPIVERDSIDMDQAFAASRYGKGGADYLNCPLDRDTYLAFVKQLCEGQTVLPQDFEKELHFEGCLPIETLAKRGDMTMAFGPMKPVGLQDPRTGRLPFAVVQLRQDNRSASLYNMVGFQTKLTYPEQQRIFRTIPGLQDARFARLGSIHRNTFVNAPHCLDDRLQLRSDPRIMFAGQITGVEGYVESAASGFLAGLFAAWKHRERPSCLPPPTTALGSLLRHLNVEPENDFQPMNVTYGLFPPLETRIKKRRERREAMALRALKALERWWVDNSLHC